MKKFIKILMLAAIVTVIVSSNAFATTIDTGDGEEITLHIKNRMDWPNFYIYNWGSDSGELFSGWQGYKLENPDENGWITINFKSKGNLNLVFSSDYNEDGMYDKNNDRQTGDIKDVPNTIKEAWVIVAGEQSGTEEEVNDLEVDAAASGYLYTIPLSDSWPRTEGFVAPAEELYTKENVDFEPTSAPEPTEAPEAAVTETTGTDDTQVTTATAEEEADTGNIVTIIAIILIVLVVAIVGTIVFIKLKDKKSEN